MEDAIAGSKDIETVFPHKDGEVIEESKYDGEPGNRVPGDSVDEDSHPLPPISAEVLTMPAQDEDFGGLGKNVSELISEDTYVCTNGTIHGTLNYVTGYTSFNATKPEEQKGYYFPFVLTPDSGTKMTFVKNGVVTKKDIPYDKEILFRVMTPNTTYEVIVDGKSVVKLNFRTAKFNPAVA